MAATCNLNSALKNADKCKLDLAGTGDRVFFFDKEAFLAKIAAANEGVGKYPEPDESGAYAEDAFAQLEGLLAAVDIKPNSGQVTSSKGAEINAGSSVGTFVVVDNVPEFNKLEHSLRFKDFGCLIPKTDGSFYVIMSPYKKTTIESNYDSGTTYDSDHGFTVTVTAAPVEFGITTWKPADSIPDLSAWTIEKKVNLPA